ncbi:dipeptidase [Thermococcus sp.]
MGIHEEAFVFDAHSDILYNVFREHKAGRKNVIAEDFLPDMKKGGINARVLAIYLDNSSLPEMALRHALDYISNFYEELETTPEISLCRNYKEVMDAYRSGKIAFILGMEGAEPLGNDIDILRIFYELGLRVLTLTHSRRNYVGDGAFLKPQKSGTPGGLSPFGIEVLEEAHKLGIIIDVSHLNDPGFWDVIEFSNDPIIASHSNCRALVNHPRNLTDEQIKAIAERGGVIGMNAAGLFVDEKEPTLDKLIDHIDHIVELVGVKHVGLGFDFFDYTLKYLSEEERRYLPLDNIYTKDLIRDSDVPKLTEKLIERGYSERDIKRILGENFLEVFKKVVG